MSDVEEEEDDLLSATWVPYAERPEWSDVTPVKIRDDPNPIMKISYSPKFRDVYGYFNAILLSGEKSLRALELTRDAAILNPANYTVWYYRRQILFELNVNLDEELYFISVVIFNNPKNYQVWQHRRALIEHTKRLEGENEFVRKILRMDSKNYHAWQHRQWYVKEFNYWDEELAFSEALIDEDIRNNSAWNHRFFVIKNTTGFDKVLVRELNFTMEKLKQCNNNESAWNYLRGIVDIQRFIDFPEIVEYCESSYANGERERFVLEVLIDMLNEKLSDSKYSSAEQERKVLLDKLETYYNEIVQVDPIRRKYWTYIYENIIDSVNKRRKKQQQEEKNEAKKDN